MRSGRRLFLFFFSRSIRDIPLVPFFGIIVTLFFSSFVLHFPHNTVRDGSIFPLLTAWVMFFGDG